MTRRWVIGIVAVIGIGLVCLRVAHRASRAPTAAARLQPAAGDELLYHLRWSGTSHAPGTGELAQLGAGEARGEVDLDGEVAIRALANGQLGLRITRLDRAQLVMLGKPVLDDATATSLVGREVAVELDAGGSIASVAAPADAPPVLLPIARAIAVQLAVHKSPAATYEARGRDLFGEVTYAYRRSGAGLSRTRVRYETLDSVPLLDCRDCTQTVGGEATIVLAKDGTIDRLVDHVSLSVRRDAPVLEAENELVLERVGRVASTTPRPDTSAWTRIAAAAVGGDPQLALRDRAGGLTFDELDGWIVRVAATGTEPQDRMWLSRATALLELEPSHLPALVKLFQSRGMPDKARFMVLDLLANTRTPAAQAALREAVDSAASGDDNTFAAMLNRFMLVKDPSKDTVAWVAGLRERVADRPLVVRGTALYVEGTVIGELAASDHPAALTMGRALVDELRDEPDPAQRAYLVSALGNADLDELVGEVIARAADPDPRVRAAAALSLRDRLDSDAAATVVALAADLDREVQESALHAIAHGHPPDSVLASLATNAPGGADRALVDALAPGARRLPEVATALRAVMARNPNDLALAAQIRAMLGDDGAQVGMTDGSGAASASR